MIGGLLCKSLVCKVPILVGTPPVWELFCISVSKHPSDALNLKSIHMMTKQSVKESLRKINLLPPAGRVHTV
jgi:hypothetical protein